MIFRPSNSAAKQNEVFRVHVWVNREKKGEYVNSGCYGVLRVSLDHAAFLPMVYHAMEQRRLSRISLIISRVDILTGIPFFELTIA